MNVVVFRYDLFAVNIHLLNVKYLICKVNALSDYFQQGGIYSCRIKGFKDHERAKQHCYAIAKLHCAVKKEEYGCSCDHNTGKLADKILNTHSRYRSYLCPDICIFLSVYSLVKPCIILTYKIIVPYLGNTLYIFKNDADDISVRFKLFIGNSCNASVCPLVYKEKYKNAEY